MNYRWAKRLSFYSLGLGVFQDFTKLKVDTQAKNIAAWTPVVAEILQGFVKFEDKAVCALIPMSRCPTQPSFSSRDIFPLYTL